MFLTFRTNQSWFHEFVYPTSVGDSISKRRDFYKKLGNFHILFLSWVHANY